MSSISERYINSQAGKLTEELKKAYLAGQNIVYIVAKDYAVVKEAINNDPVFFLFSRPVTANAATTTSSLGTVTQEKKTVVSQNLFYGIESLKRAAPNQPCMYVVTVDGKRRQGGQGDKLDECLKNFVDCIAGFTDRSSNEYFKKSMVVVVTPHSIDIPDEVVPYSRMVRVEQPNAEETEEKIVSLVEQLDGICLDSEPGGDSYMKLTANLTRGLALNKVAQIFSRIKYEMDSVYVNVNSQEKTKEFEAIVMEEKAKLIENSAILRLVKTSKAAMDMSGMEGLSQWVKTRRQIILKPDESLADALVPQPKGVLLAGIPGTGKSLAAKTTAAAFGGLPLLQLDMGNIMDKYQGESEHKMEEALRLAEAMSPCVLWIDEIEKGIAGASGDSGNSEAMKRIFGKLLTWMQEKEERGVCCFVFATANDVSNIPPELFRSGRFDEKFYTFLPTHNECVEIFKNIIKSQDKAFRKLHSKKGLPERSLFDRRIFDESFFGGILDSQHVLREKVDTDCKKVPRDNKFVTGSDIEAIIQCAKLNMYVGGMTSADDGSPVYNAAHFREALYRAFDETRTYGQTNARQIALCYAKMAENNFRPVSGSEIVPFRLFDQTAENGQPLLDMKSEMARQHLDGMDNDYDRQLFLYMGIAVNQFLKTSGK